MCILISSSISSLCISRSVSHYILWSCVSAGSGASTYTLDSGIGTFPLPDCSSGAAGRGLSKTRAGAEHHSGSPGRAGRRARTLDRELTTQDECYTPHKQLIPTIQYGSMLEGRSSGGVIREGANTLPTFRTILDLMERNCYCPGNGLCHTVYGVFRFMLLLLLCDLLLYMFKI